jgi:DNA-binding winged helix-turn-helix (wHTH) protein
LRDVLQPFGYHDYVHTIRGHGYKFTSQLWASN